jgi:hypothetical protein
MIRNRLKVPWHISEPATRSAAPVSNSRSSACCNQRKISFLHGFSKQTDSAFRYPSLNKIDGAAILSDEVFTSVAYQKRTQALKARCPPKLRGGSDGVSLVFQHGAASIAGDVEDTGFP